MLRIDASPSELARLRSALTRIAEDEETVFDALFDPLAPRTRARLRRADDAELLRSFGLAVDEGGDLFGAHRIRRRDGRFYVMELGGVAEYHQDVWPETDAMLGALDEAAPGSLLDLGTGSGIVAIEAAARGHRVVATDLYPTALALARFNAALNGQSGTIDFRQGHWCDPVEGERFDLILTAPHYTRLADQLRLEVLRSAPAHVAPGGKMVMATFLEWEGEAGPLAAVEVLLAPLAAAGASVAVRPIVAALKRQWFHVSRSSEPIAGLVSRHRFLVTISPGGSGLHVERPAIEAQRTQLHVPLARLRLDGAAGIATGVHAVISTGADVAALRALLGQMRRGLVRIGGEVPAGLLDGCRFGAKPCLTEDGSSGAAGAILDERGGVRPCSHGAAIGRADDAMASLQERLRLRAVEAAARRGCATCPASAVCSRCLHPGPLDEAGYCDLIRAEADLLPSLHRLIESLRPLGDGVAGPIRVKLRRTVALVAAHGRPFSVAADPENPAEPLVRALAARWRERCTWILRGGDRYALSTVRDGASGTVFVEAATAELGELIADGATAGELALYRRGRFHDPRTERRVFRDLGEILGGSAR